MLTSITRSPSSFSGNLSTFFGSFSTISFPPQTNYTSTPFSPKLTASRFFSKVTEETLDPNQLYKIGLDLYQQRNFAAAVNNFKLGAEKKHPECQNAYAICLLNGDGVPKDANLAAHFFQEAASQGSKESQFYLGYLHLNGLGGLPKDMQKAADFFKISADNGYGNSCFLYSYLLIGGHESNEKKPPKIETDREKFQRLNRIAFSYLEKGCELGNPSCQFALGTALFKGEGIKQNKRRAIDLLQKSATKEDVKALNYYGQLLQKGVVIFEAGDDDIELPVVLLKKNEEEAVKFFGIAASRFNPEGLYHYGTVLLNGRGVPKDTRRALIFIKKSAELGFPDGICQLAEMLENGIEVQKDLEKAAKLYKQAADNGSKAAAIRYGRMCLQGIGVPKNEEEAANYFKLATKL